MDASVLQEGSSILPFDDVEMLVKDKAKFAVAPCYCRYTALLKEGVEDAPTMEEFVSGQFDEYFSPLCDSRVETCIMMGDEAEFWVDKGWARYITEEECLACLRRSRDDGFILQSCWTKDSATICSCNMKSCNILKKWMMLGGPEEIAAAPSFKHISHYNLVVDLDSCIKCGACAQRCPKEVITMDEQTGYPTVGVDCWKCGQCAYVCPQGARKLAQKPEEEIPELPRDFLDDANRKAAWRFETGWMD